MIGLPHGFTEPLHIDKPLPYGLIATLLVLIALLVWLIHRRRKRKSQEPPTPPRRRRRPGIRGAIESLRRKHLKGKNFRLACHELAAALRDHFDRETGHPISSLTTREMIARIGDTALTRMFGLLAQLQFSRSKPSRSDFEGACDLALDVTRSAPRRGKR